MSWYGRFATVRVASVAIGGVLVVASLSACAGSSEQVSTANAAAVSSAPSGPRPTIVFVHGSWADSSGFDAELTDLSRQGYPVTAIPDPLRGLSADAAYVRARLQTIPGPIVLVGHSYGGAVIGAAATGLTNVKALVYLAGWSLDQGDSVLGLTMKFPGSHLDPTKFDPVSVPDPSASGGKTTYDYIKPADFADIFAADVSPQEARLEAETQQPMAEADSTQTGAPAWKTIPAWYLVTLNDHAIPPAAQKFMADRMHAHTTEVASSHDVMISHPADVDRIILQAAAAS